MITIKENMIAITNTSKLNEIISTDDKYTPETIEFAEAELERRADDLSNPVCIAETEHRQNQADAYMSLRFW